jgi:hypothetical protein
MTDDELAAIIDGMQLASIVTVQLEAELPPPNPKKVN